MFIIFTLVILIFYINCYSNNWYKMTINSCAKFEMTWFDGTSNFELWQMRVKDMLPQQNLQKVVCERKIPTWRISIRQRWRRRLWDLFTMCFRRYDVSYLGPNDNGGGFGQIGELVFLKTLMNKVFVKQWLYSLKMWRWSDLQHVNVFKNININLVRFVVKIDDKDKSNYLIMLVTRFLWLLSDSSYTRGRQYQFLRDYWLLHFYLILKGN